MFVGRGGGGGGGGSEGRRRVHKRIPIFPIGMSHKTALPNPL